LPASTSSSWTGLNSIQPDDDLPGFTVTRELRTRSATPNAPRLDTLFARDNAPPAQVLVVWDPGHHWPQFSLTHLALPPTQPLQRVLLRQENASEVMAEFFVAGSGAIGPSGWACVQVVTQPGDPLGLRIGLSLMEQAPRAVLLAGGPADKDLVRRIGEFVRSSQWEGPPLIVVAPADKPSRAERLRTTPARTPAAQLHRPGLGQGASPPMSRTAERQAELTRPKAAAALLKAQDAVLVAHYYVDGDLQDLALETGGCVADSLEMARFGRDHAGADAGGGRRALHGRVGQDPVAATSAC
jgi:hypothetical protein